MTFNNVPEALFVDVIGTVVNWRSVVTKCLSTGAKIALSPSSPTSATIPPAVRTQAEKTNWRNIAEEWHDSYISITRAYTRPNPSSSTSSPSSSPPPPPPSSTSFSSSSTTTFINFDDHMIPALTAILAAHNLANLFDPEEISSYARIWHFLDPYPDSLTGISSLKKIIPSVYALSNGNATLLTELAAWNKIEYSGIFSAEEFKEYAPSAAIYEGVAKKLQVEKGKCGLVCARLGDLKVAKGLGWFVAYVQREGEEDWSEADVVRAKEEGWVDLWVGQGGEGKDRGGLVAVAARLGRK